MFVLDPKLAGDTIALETLQLSRLLLMNDAAYPWLILVPERDNVREIYELNAADRGLLMDEIARVSETMVHMFRPDKINVAALGNVVPQLHIHVVARFVTDASWPNPIWGRHPAKAYDPSDARRIADALRISLRLGEL